MGDREDIEILDSKVAKLKVDYEQYFARVLKREPAQLRDEVDRLVLNLSGRTFTNTSFKFKLNSVVAKYNTLKQYWTRVLRAIEEGTYVRRAEGVAEMGVKSSRPASEPLGKPIPKQAAAESQPRQNAAKDDGVDELYRKYIEARKQCNEPTEGITPETLKKTVEQYKKKVEEQYHTSEFDLKVSIKDGKTKLTITPKKTGA